MSARTAMEQPLGEIEIDQDLAFQRREWIAERVGWVVMALFVLAATVGVFGSGYLSRGGADVPGMLRVEYQRFARYETPEDLTVHVPSNAREEVGVGLDRAYLAHTTVDSVTPPPLRVESRADRLVYVFRLATPGEGLTVVFQVQPERIGAHRARVTIEPGAATAPPATLTFRQLVYP